MRVGMIVPGFSANEQDWCIPALRHLVRRLASINDVRVFALRYPSPATRYALFGAEVTALGGGDARGRGSAGLWRRTATTLAAEHRRRPFDVLHAFWAGEPGFLAALAGRLLGVPSVVSLAGGELARLRDIGYGGGLRRLERTKTRLALGLAHIVTAGSELALASAQLWLRSHPACHLRRIPLGVDLAMFAPRSSPAAGGPLRILHVASLSPVKDQATLLTAMGMLRRRGCPFMLQIAGSGPLESALRSLADELGVADVVTWRGEIGHDRLPGEYQRAQLFVLSSRHEAQGMAALEAAACGMPVVGTQVGVLPELAPDGARIAPVGDAGALADQIVELTREDAARVRAGTAAREHAVGEFGLERCVSRFAEVYAEVADGERGHRV